MTDPPTERHIPDVLSHAYTGMLSTMGSQKGQQHRNACSQKGAAIWKTGSQKGQQYGRQAVRGDSNMEDRQSNWAAILKAGSQGGQKH